MLKSAQYRLILASNGRDAINRAGILRPDLILMDIRMPEMDGLTACRVLKAHEDTRDIPLIFLTAANETPDRLLGLRLGAVDYIVKPASEEEVLLRMAVHLKTRSGDRESIHFSTQAHSRETSALVEACIRILEEDLGLSPSTQDLARKLGCSRRFLNNAFKEVFNATVYEWLRERRMQQASQWLTETSIPVQDIAEDLGFSSASNFTTAFRLRFGLAPRDFKKALLREHTPLNIKEQKVWS
jgi:YesN/AraC family two-component response regulator